MRSKNDLHLCEIDVNHYDVSQEADKLWKLGGGIKQRVMEKGFAKMSGIGDSAVTNLLKALERANRIIAREKEEANEEPLHIWAFPNDRKARRDEEDKVTAQTLELVVGPAP